MFIFVLWMFFYCFYDNQELIPAVEMLFPTVEHRFCVKHIYNNFKLNFKGLKLKATLWRCAATTIVREFDKRIQDLKKLDKKSMGVSSKHPTNPMDQVTFHFKGHL